MFARHMPAGYLVGMHDRLRIESEMLCFFEKRLLLRLVKRLISGWVVDGVEERDSGDLNGHRLEEGVRSDRLDGSDLGEMVWHVDIL